MKPRLGKRMSCKVVVACSTKSLKKFSTYLFYRSSKKLLLMRFNWSLGSKKILVSFIGIIFWMCRFLLQVAILQSGSKKTCWFEQDMEKVVCIILTFKTYFMVSERYNFKKIGQLIESFHIQGLIYNSSLPGGDP